MAWNFSTAKQAAAHVEGKKKRREVEAAAKNSLLRSSSRSSSGDEKITYARSDVIISGENTARDDTSCRGEEFLSMSIIGGSILKLLAFWMLCQRHSDLF
jgi:hypothetical protein